MTQKVDLFFYAALIGLVCVSLYAGYRLHDCFQSYEEIFTDTVEVVTTTTKVDTVYQYRPQYCAKKVVDTVYIPCKEDVCEIPIEQIEYMDSLYHLWVSGYKPTLDSIKICKWNNYVERIRTVTDTKVVRDTKGHIFTGIGVQQYQKSYIPSINVYYSKKDFLIGVTAGLFDNKPIYGVNVNYKLR